MVICEVCDKTFSKFFNLSRHKYKVHGITVRKREVVRKFQCEICKKTFIEDRYLKAHTKKFHKDNQKKLDPICELKQDCRDLNDQEAHVVCTQYKSFLCNFCGYQTQYSSNLLRHLKEKHQQFSKKSTSVICPECDRNVLNRNGLLKHLKETHNIDVELERLQFPSEDDFNKWKRDEENKNALHFIKRTSYGNKIYYICNRSGCQVNRSKGIRLRFKKSVKIGKTCPASILKIISDEGIVIDYYKTHLGHEKSIQFLKLKKIERAAIADKIASGLTFDHILDDIRESVNGEMRRFHLTGKKDLYNIVKEFNLADDSTQDFRSNTSSISEEASETHVSERAQLQDMLEFMLGSIDQVPDSGVQILLEKAKTLANVWQNIITDTNKSSNTTGKIEQTSEERNLVEQILQSTKKKGAKQCRSIHKSTDQYKHNLRKILNGEEETEYIHTGFDHTYE